MHYYQNKISIYTSQLFCTCSVGSWEKWLIELKYNKCFYLLEICLNRISERQERPLPCIDIREADDDDVSIFFCLKQSVTLVNKYP